MREGKSRPADPLGAADFTRTAAAPLYERADEHVYLHATSQLVAGILHEFSTPLGALRSSLDTAHRATARLAALIPSSQEQGATLLARMDEILAVARTAAEHMVGTLEALSRFARVEQDNVVEVDASKVLERVLHLTGVARAEHVRVECTIEPSSLRVRCRVREIEQVLYHLVRNAFEAVKDCVDPTIEIAAYRQGVHVVVSVHDNGPGIDPARLPTIFEPALRAKDGTVSLGISLATCRCIAAAHGGSLEAENAPSGGARFTFRFREDLPAS